MNYKLLPCPFCGAKARFTQKLTPELTQGSYTVKIAVVCTECQACSCWSKVRAEVVRAWNRRIS